MKRASIVKQNIKIKTKYKITVTTIFASETNRDTPSVMDEGEGVLIKMKWMWSKRERWNEWLAKEKLLRDGTLLRSGIVIRGKESK